MYHPHTNPTSRDLEIAKAESDECCDWNKALMETTKIAQEKVDLLNSIIKRSEKNFNYLNKHIFYFSALSMHTGTEVYAHFENVPSWKSKNKTNIGLEKLNNYFIDIRETK